MSDPISRRDFVAGAAAAGMFSAIAAKLAAEEKPAAAETQAPEKPRSMAEMRAEFLKDFKRGGLSTTAGDAMLLRILVEARGAKRGVEVGSYHGYGAINMGIAFERTGGKLITLEIDPAAVKVCRENLQKTSLDKTVTCIEGDALKVLPTLEGEFDFVFLDAKKDDYLKYYQLIAPRLKAGAVVCADNVIRSANAMKDFLDFVQTSPDLDTATIRASMEKNDGMTVSYKIR